MPEYISKLKLNGTTYDLKPSVDGSSLETKNAQSGTVQSDISTSIAANTSMDNAIGTLLNNDATIEDEKTDKLDITYNITTGSTNNSGRKINKGKYFYTNGELAIANEDIDMGATLTQGTNCKSVRLIGGFTDLLTNRYYTGAERTNNYSYDQSVTIRNWGAYQYGLIVGFMNGVGGFVGTIYGTTFTKIAGTDISSYATFSLSGTDLTITANDPSKTFRFTLIPS